jgi:hypothetical protein
MDVIPRTSFWYPGEVEDEPVDVEDEFAEVDEWETASTGEPARDGPFVEIRAYGRLIPSDGRWVEVPGGDLVATIELAGGVAVATVEGMCDPKWLDDFAVEESDTLLTPEDGERYLRALPDALTEDSWRATFHEPIAVLVSALEGAGHGDLADRVRAEQEHPFDVPVSKARRDALAADLRERGEGALAERVASGVFKPSSNELEEWFDGPGGQFALRATETYMANRRRAESEGREGTEGAPVKLKQESCAPHTAQRPALLGAQPPP